MKLTVSQRIETFRERRERYEKYSKFSGLLNFFSIAFQFLPHFLREDVKKSAGLKKPHQFMSRTRSAEGLLREGKCEARSRRASVQL
jgi:hypothetical protein